MLIGHCGNNAPCTGAAIFCITSDKNSDFSFFNSLGPSPKHRMCVVSASNPIMGAYKPVLITAGAENYSLVAIQRPYHVAKWTTCASRRQSGPGQHKWLLRKCRRRAQRAQPPDMGAMKHEQGRGGAGIWYNPPISGKRPLDLAQARAALCCTVLAPSAFSDPPPQPEPMHLDIFLARCKRPPSKL